MALIDDARSITSLKWRTTGTRGPITEVAEDGKTARRYLKRAKQAGFNSIQERFKGDPEFHAAMRLEKRGIEWCYNCDIMAKTKVVENTMPYHKRAAYFSGKQYLVSTDVDTVNTTRITSTDEHARMMLAVRANDCLAGGEPHAGGGKPHARRR